MRKYNYIIASLLGIILFSCKPEIQDDFKPSNGSLDFSTYVSIGNSLTAGYADGALYNSAQTQSWPSILAAQLKEVGNGNFAQPVVESEQGVLPGKLSLQLIDGNLLPVPADDGELEGVFPIGYEVNNLGVPGAKVGHLLFPGLGNPNNLANQTANPYFIRFATSPDISVLDQALDMNPTFFSLWIGSNDVLGYATSGGVDDMITPTPEFEAQYAALAAGLASSGAQGILANIPSVTAAPFFTTVPINALVIDEPTAQQLNQGIAAVENQLNQILNSLGLPTVEYDIEFTAGPNNFLIEDRNFVYRDLFNAVADTSSDPVQALFLRRVQFRQATNNELLTLQTPQDSLALGMGSFIMMEGIPTPVPYGVPNVYVLDESELNLINSAITDYNQFIENTAENYGWAFLNVNEIFNDISVNGFSEDGINMTGSFVTGGLFSLDGIHLTPRGNALVSNFFVDAINEQYGTKISKVYLSQYPAVIFP